MKITTESEHSLRDNTAEHPFFCWKNRCRKTVWDTPEYLTDSDWLIARELSLAASCVEYSKVINAAYSNGAAEALFHRVLGWPEGFHYCKSDSFLTGPAWSGFKQHEQEKLQAAVSKHFKYCGKPRQQGGRNA